MNVIPTRLPEVLVVEPKVHRDDRGYFVETYHARRYADAGLGVTFVQDNQSRSVRGTLRGLHWQVEHPQGKLVRALSGEIFDVAVDIRPDSPRFGQWVGVTLSAESFQQIYVPPGFAHGFRTLAPNTEVIYKVTAPYEPQHERGIRFDDPALGIDWRHPASEIILSSKDRAAPMLADAEVFV